MATAAKGHMPFPGHRTLAEIREGVRPAPPVVAPICDCTAFVAVQPRNQKLIDEANRLAGRWR